MTTHTQHPQTTLRRPVIVTLVSVFALFATAAIVTAQTIVQPTAPTLSLGTVTSRTITVDWVAPAEPVTSYEITWRAAVNCETGTPMTVTVPASATSHLFEVLESSTDYAFQIRGVNSVVKGVSSDCVTGTTSSLNTSAGKPTAVTAVTVGAKTQSSFNLSWTAPSDVGSGAVDEDIVYDIYWDTDSSCTDNKVYGRGRTTRTSFLVDSFRGGVGLSPNTQYWYAIRADNGGTAGIGDWTTCTQVTTERVLDVPVNVSDISRTSETITLGWGLPNIFSQTKIERNKQIPDNGGSSRPLVSTINVPTQATINAVSVTVDITHTYIGDLKVELIAPGGTAIALHDRAGDGADDIKQTYTTELSGLLGTSSRGNWQLRVADHSTADAGQLNSWTLTVGDTSRITDYQVERFTSQKACLDDDDTDAIAATPISGVDPVTRTVTATALSPATTYWFRVRSSDGINFSAYSTCVAARTGQGIIVPKDLQSTAVTKDSVFLSWSLPGIFSEKKVEERAIPDNGRSQSVSSTINVPTAITIDSISVTVDIDHNYIGDLKVDLVTPRGTTIVLHDEAGGNRKNLKTTYTTTEVPALLDLFDTSAQGNWRLRVGDYEDPDTGQLNSWTLTIGDVASIINYDVEQFSSAASCEDITTTGTAVTDVTVNSRVAVARNLDAGTAYWFRVRSSDGVNDSAYSPCVSATTETGVPTPNNVRSVTKTDESITLTWDFPNIFSETKIDNVNIPDNTGVQSVTSTIAVPSSLTIDYLSVAVDITHNYINDLKVDLVTPDGTIIVLHPVNTGGSQKNIKTTYDTQFGDFIGTDAQGNWQLRVGDYGTNDDGQLKSWTLTIGDISSITNYTVELFTSEKTCADTTTTGTVITTIDVPARTATVTGLIAQTPYWFRVRSTDNVNTSGFSPCVSITTSRGVLTPKNFRTVGSTADNVFLAWDLPGVFSETKVEDAQILDNADRQSVVSTITVSDSTIIDALSVSVDITHTFVGDLKIDLVAPDGTEYLLHNLTGTSRGNFTKTYTTELEDLVGTDMKGNWRLRVGDYEATDVGHLNSWTLTVGDTSRITDYEVELFASQKVCSGTAAGIGVPTVDVDARTATTTGLSPDTTYWFRVRSSDGTTYSPYSSCISATTGTGVLVPTNLRSVASTDQSVTIGWDLVPSFSRTETENAIITDNSGSQATVSTIAVPAGTIIGDMTVSVDIAHSRVGDLKIDLITPDGAVVVLQDQTGGGQVNLRTSYTTQFASLAGDSAQGDWQLRVGDYKSRDTGTLKSWTLDIVDSSQITGYDLEHFTSSKACRGGSGGTIVPSVNVATRTAQLTSLTTGTELWLRARSTDGTNNSTYSDCVSVSVGRIIPQPTNLRSTAVDDNSVSLAWSVPGAFTATQTENAPIADNTNSQSITSVITVPAGTTVDGMAVAVDITHTYIGDLVVDLVSPGGTVVVLHDETGGENDDLRMTYTDQFATFNGSNAAGQWQLRVGDYGPSDIGSLNAWTLTIGDTTAVTGHTLERFTSENDCTSGSNAVTVTPIDVSAKTAVATGLVAGTKYWFRVNATDGTLVSEYSPCLETSTSKTVQQVTNLRSVDANDSSISLAWDFADVFSETKTENVAIADNTQSQSVTSAIVVPHSTPITAMSISVDITHTYIGDLVIELIKPDGTSLSLHNRSGATHDDLTVTYTDEFTSLLGTDAQGTWQLSVGDYGNRDTGTLNSWTITFGNVAGAGIRYDVERFDSESACTSGTGGVNVSVESNARAVTITELAPTTTYWFRARAVQGGIDGPFSNCVSVATLKPVKQVSDTVVDLRSLMTTDSEIVLTWDIDGVFSRTIAPGTAIPDGTGRQDVTSILSIAEKFSIEDISVSVDITHPYPQDLIVDLVVPNNKNGIILHNKESVAGGNISATYSGEPLPSLVGISAQGDWTLRVGDYAADDVGTLNAWTLTLGDTSHFVAYDLEQFTSRKHCQSGEGSAEGTVDVHGENDETRTARITGLSPNTSYWFRVRAYDDSDWTPYTDCVEVTTAGPGKDSGDDGDDNTTPLQKPAYPTDATASEITDTSFRLSWSNPKNTGGADNGDLFYEVTWDNEQSCLITDNANRSLVYGTMTKISRFNGEDLTPGTGYWYAIRTNNGTEYSDWSLCSYVQTTKAGVTDSDDNLTAPSAPRNPQGNPTSNYPMTQIVVIADSPETDGGSPITSHGLQVYEGSCGGTVVTAKSKTVDLDTILFLVDGLTKSTTYCFEVTSTNRVGTSPAAQVTVTTLDSGNPPLSFGDTDDTDDDKTDSGDNLPLSFGNLDDTDFCRNLNPSSRNDRVSINIFCPKRAAELKAAELAARTVPSAPRNLRGEPSSNDPTTELAILADSPETDGGSPITSHTLTVYESVCGGTVVTTKSKTTQLSRIMFRVSNLTKNTTYCLEVTSTNAIGVSPVAQVTVATQDDAVPFAPMWHNPQNWHASSSHISATWKQNRRERLPILTYEWYRYSDSACTQDEYELPIPDSFGSSITAHAMDLESGTTYYFKVRAKNRVGFGPFSTCQEATTREA